MLKEAWKAARPEYLGLRRCFHHVAGLEMVQQPVLAAGWVSKVVRSRQVKCILKVWSIFVNTLPWVLTNSIRFYRREHMNL